jgi:flagellar motility protein MotE (MotC chaperone)
MKKMLIQAGLALMILCTSTVLILGGLGLLFLMNGTLTKERLRSAWAELRGKKEAPKPVEPATVEEEWAKLEETRARIELTLRKREEELKSLEARTKLDLAQIEIDRRALEESRAAAEKALAELKKEREAFEQKKIDAVTKANLPIFEEMKGQDLSALMAGWSDADVIRYLRLLSPEKAADVLKAMGQQGSPWREAPKNGGPTRYQQIATALK